MPLLPPHTPQRRSIVHLSIDYLRDCISTDFASQRGELPPGRRRASIDIPSRCHFDLRLYPTPCTRRRAGDVPRPFAWRKEGFLSNIFVFDMLRCHDFGPSYRFVRGMTFDLSYASPRRFTLQLSASRFLDTFARRRRNFGTRCAGDDCRAGASGDDRRASHN
jgi:hypothetical protein